MGHPVAYCKEPRDYFAPSCEGNIFQGAEFQVTVETFKGIHLFAIRLAKIPRTQTGYKKNPAINFSTGRRSGLQNIFLLV